MAEFLDVATSLHRSGRAGAYQADFDTVFRAIGALQVVHSKARLDIANIESVFAAFEFAQIINSFCGYDQAKIPGLAESARALITQTIEETVLFPVSGTDVSPPQPYNRFAQLVLAMREWCRPAHDVSVITFNYDFAPDFAFKGFGHGIDYGFGPSRSNADALPLLKLHGSISWAACSVCSDIVPQSFANFMTGRMPGYGSDRLKIDFSRHFLTLNHCNQRVRPQSVLVPPTWNKSVYHGKLASVWSTAARELADTANVFVIGYSLPETDVFFKYLYALGTVGKMPLERFWVFDPDLPDRPGSVRERFSSLLGPGAEQRFQYFRQTFDSGISTLQEALKVPTGPA